MSAFFVALEIWRGFPRIVRLALLIAAGVAAFVAWLAIHDRGVVKAHDAKAAATTARAVTRADRAAIAADAQREVQRQADSAETRRAIDNAVHAKPEDVRRPAGPAVRAAADSLRRRQQGRSAASRNAAP